MDGRDLSAGAVGAVRTVRHPVTLARGAIAWAFDTPGMYRGAADSAGRFEVAIWEELEPSAR